MSGCLKLKVKQGEEIDVSFSITQKEYNETIKKDEVVPLPLDGYKVRFQVKNIPLEKVEPMIDKEITTDSDPYVVGQITDETNGKLFVHLTKEDTSFNTGDYSLIISLVAEHTNDIISSSYCEGAKYIIYEQ